MLARNDNWQNELAECIEARRDTPYSITNFNCLMWGLEVVQAITGVDYYSAFGNNWKTEAQAAKVFRKVSKVKQTREYIEKLFGSPQPLAMLRKGDLVVADIDHDEISNIDLFGPPIGVCNGKFSYFVGPSGLVALETLSLGQASYGFHC